MYFSAGRPCATGANLEHDPQQREEAAGSNVLVAAANAVRKPVHEITEDVDEPDVVGLPNRPDAVVDLCPELHHQIKAPDGGVEEPGSEVRAAEQAIRDQADEQRGRDDVCQARSTPCALASSSDAPSLP